MFECFLLRNKTKQQTNQELELEKERLDAKIKSAALEGLDLTEELNKLKRKSLSEKERIDLFNTFLMTTIWTLGASLEENSRPKFSVFLTQLVQSNLENPLY